jgi:hypothetical protein
MEMARVVAPTCRVKAEGAEFLAVKAAEYPQVFESHYRGELLALRHGLLAGQIDLPPSSNGLRIVMATQFGEDALALRSAALTNLLRLALAKGEWTTRNALHTRVSSEFGLARPVNIAYFDAAVEELRSTQEVEVATERLRLTELGRASAKVLLDDAKRRLLDGRDTFRAELNQRLGDPLTEVAFDTFWVRFQDTLADLFHAEGMAVVRAILDPDPSTPIDAHAGGGVMERLAAQVIPPGLSPRQSAAVAAAVLGIVSGDSKTREWLGQVAATFVSLCALGLHPEAQEELLARLRRWELMVDNHVVISFLCRGEGDHDGVKRIIDAWRRMGRTVGTCVAVLEEAAYHAFAADRVYQDLWQEFPTIPRDEAQSAIPNAFTRSFFLLNPHDGHTPKRWAAYIRNFAGSSEFDCGRLKAEICAAGWRVFDDTQFPSAAVDYVREGLPGGTGRRSRSATIGKADRERRGEWDARTALAAVKRGDECSTADGNVIIVTKSHAIRAACDFMATTSRLKVSVMSVAALGYAMALTPGLSVSLVHIRDLLFDRHLLSRAFSRLESHARRLADRDRDEGFDLAGNAQLRERVCGEVGREFQRIDKAVNDKLTLSLSPRVTHRSPRRRGRAPRP